MSANEIIFNVFPSLNQGDLTADFKALNIDSFDLMTLRVTLERQLGYSVPDVQWLEFRRLQDISNFYAQSRPLPDPTPPPGRHAERCFTINMPQMAVGGLSEGWLFREIGDIHWSAICAALGVKSHTIADSLGNRLYATFVHIRWECTDSLRSFGENDALCLRSRLSRYGASMFFSQCTSADQLHAFTISLMSTFALRQSDNTSLLRGEPIVPAEHEALDVLAALPHFATEYRQMRSHALPNVTLLDDKFSVSDAVLFETEYDLNPYQDFNGVNLLYFAAYSSISDTCERRFVHAHRADYNLEGDWALKSSTHARDVYFYANCNVEDTIVFRIHAFEMTPGTRARIHSSIYRKSDMQRLCSLFTIKTLFS